MIYEVIINKSTNELYLNGINELNIEVVPINSTGKRAWFRFVKTEFNFEKGIDFIEIVNKNTEKGSILLKAKNQLGVIVLLVKPKKSLYSTLIEIPIVKI